MLMVYVDSSKFDELTERLHAKQVESGANLSLWIPADEYVFYQTRTIKDRVVVSPLQLYLDLSSLSGRGSEAAEEILEKELQSAWLT